MIDLVSFDMFVGFVFKCSLTLGGEECKGVSLHIYITHLFPLALI